MVFWSGVVGPGTNFRSLARASRSYDRATRSKARLVSKSSKGSARALEPRDARNKGLSRLAPSVTRVVICVSRAFCSTDQEKRETSRSLFTLHTSELIDYLYKRGYNRYFIQREIQWVNNTRTEALTPHDTSTLDKPERVFFAITYNPALRSISFIICKHFHILISSPRCYKHKHMCKL